jgi:hypothetical protein
VGTAMEDVGIAYVNLVCFIAIWYILWPFGIFSGYLVIVSPFWNVVCSQENLATLFPRNLAIERSGELININADSSKGQCCNFKQYSPKKKKKIRVFD